MMPPFVVFPTNRIAHFVEVSLYLFYLAQRVKFNKKELYYDKITQIEDYSQANNFQLYISLIFSHTIQKIK